MSTINELVSAVANCRLQIAISNAEIAELEREFRQQHFADYGFRDDMESALAVFDAELRDAVRAEYERTGERPTHPALGIRLTKRFIYDVELATEWARVWSPGMLTLDVKKFEQVGFTLGGPIEIRTEPVATISTDLSQWVEQGE